MRQDPYLAQVFPQPPLVAYKRPDNLKNRLIRAKIPDPTPPRPRRTLIYLLGCQKCPSHYIGETSRTLQERFSEHLGYAKKKATGEHFSSKGHKQSDMEIMILEKLHNTYEQFRKQREKMFIQSFNTKHKGMNKKT